MVQGPAGGVKEMLGPPEDTENQQRWQKEFLFPPLVEASDCGFLDV